MEDKGVYGARSECRAARGTRGGERRESERGEMGDEGSSEEAGVKDEIRLDRIREDWMKTFALVRVGHNVRNEGRNMRRDFSNKCWAVE